MDKPAAFVANASAVLDQYRNNRKINPISVANAVYRMLNETEAFPPTV